MVEPRVSVPKKYWWVAVIAVPIIVAAIAASPRLMSLIFPSDAPAALSDSVVIKEAKIDADSFVGRDLHEGDQVTTHIALTFGGALPELSPAEQQMLDDAIARMKYGEFEQAIPVLQAVAEKAPTPSLLNDLAAAHFAVGDFSEAQQALNQAKSVGQEADLETMAALNWNNRRVRQALAYEETPITSVNTTQWSGVRAYLSRLDDAGGMITVHAVYRNMSDQNVLVCPYPGNAYIIDEHTSERIEAAYDSGIQSASGCISIKPGLSLPVWIKFDAAGGDHREFTLVLSAVMPFEGLAVGNARMN